MKLKAAVDLARQLLAEDRERRLASTEDTVGGVHDNACAADSAG